MYSMQPALADVVQNLIFPSSAATAGERQVVRMSFPSCLPCPRGAPKSSKYVAAPTSGKMIGCDPVGAGVPGSVKAPAEEQIARPAVASRRRARRTRAVVRWDLILSRVRGTAHPGPGFAPEGADPTRALRRLSSCPVERCGTPHWTSLLL